MSESLLIADVKTQSPFGYVSDKSWDEQFEFAAEHWSWLSIHTHERWGGSFDLLQKARRMTDKPILAKGIHESDNQIEQALDIGADFVLAVGRLPIEYSDKILYEPLSVAEIPADINPDTRIVWNKRDLATGGVKSETMADLRSVFGGWVCQASMVRSIEDVNPAANAVLVGQHLVDYVESLE